MNNSEEENGSDEWVNGWEDGVIACVKLLKREYETKEIDSLQNDSVWLKEKIASLLHHWEYYDTDEDLDCENECCWYQGNLDRRNEYGGSYHIPFPGHPDCCRGILVLCDVCYENRAYTLEEFEKDIVEKFYS